MQRPDSLEKTDVGKDGGQEEKGTTEDEIAGQHQRLSGCEYEQTLREGQGSLSCYSSGGHKASDVNERLNNKFAFRVWGQ